MMVFEKAAGAVICPRTIGTQEVTTCVGSKCMAWRWKYPDRGFRPPKDADAGYCGLAGQP